jgi:hypothetical protein
MAEAAPALNKEQLERLFSPMPKAAPRGSLASGGGGDSGSGSTALKGKGGGPRGSEVCLLDAKRAQNLAIVLRQVTQPTAELAEILRCMRVGHQVSIDTLEHMQENLVPLLLEDPRLVEYDGPTETLRDVERQLLPLARLPRLKARLRSMIFSKRMPTQHADLLKRIKLLRNACEQVRNSSALRRIMLTGLRVGNYLNHGIESGGGHDEVRGFAIESLLKFRDFRATQGGEASALHYIAWHLLRDHPDLLQVLRQELQAILEPSDGAEMCLQDGGISDLHDAASRFQSEIDLVQGEMDRFADSYRTEAGEGPIEVLQRLLEDARDMSSALNEELRTMLDTACQLLNYFGERQQPELPQGSSANEAYVAIEKFFSTIREFVCSFEECWKAALENPRKLGLEGMCAHSAPNSVPPPSTVTKQSPKAAAAAACQVAMSAANERKAKISTWTKLSGINDAAVDGQCALAAEAMNIHAAMRRRKTTGMLRLGGTDFGAVRLLPPGPAAPGD